MDLTPRQQAELAASNATPPQRIAEYQRQIAYLEALELDRAPTLTIVGNPDGADESIQLTIAGPDYLAAFKEVTVAALQKMSREVAAELPSASLPEGSTTSQLVAGNGPTVTTVHSSPSSARSKADGSLD